MDEALLGHQLPGTSVRSRRTTAWPVDRDARDPRSHRILSRGKHPRRGCSALRGKDAHQWTSFGERIGRAPRTGNRTPGSAEGDVGAPRGPRKGTRLLLCQGCSIFLLNAVRAFFPFLCSRVFFATQLRDIEILVQQQAEDLAKEGKEDVTLSEIQKILYSTEVRHPSILFFFIARLAYDLRHRRRASRFQKAERLGRTRRRLSSWGFFLAHVYLRVTVSIIPVVPAVALSGLS
jgi:hypothetical protein